MPGPLQFVDRYVSTLASQYTAGGTSLNVSSAATLPSGTDLFYVIVQAEGANTEEVFLVTAVSGTILTVTGAQANTSASNHGAGATIIGSIMTANAFAQLKTDLASPTFAPPYILLGGNYYGPVHPLSLPPAASWSWINQGTSSATARNGAWVLAFQNTGTDTVRGYLQQLPASTGYTLIIGVCNCRANNFGVGITDLTKLQIAYMQGGGANLTYQYWATATSTAGLATILNNVTLGVTGASVLWFRFQDSGGNRTLSTSPDGVNWTVRATQSSGANLTETYAGVFYETSEPTAQSPGTGMLVSYLATTP